MPLVWAHAEHLKLQRSLSDGRIFDLPPQTLQRYRVDKTVSPRLIWRYNHKIRSIPIGKILRVELLASATVHWTCDDWRTATNTGTRDAGLGIHLADLPIEALHAGSQVTFTFHWSVANRWEGKDFLVRIAASEANGLAPQEKARANGK
jgi:glucoamylase